MMKVQKILALKTEWVLTREFKGPGETLMIQERVTGCSKNVMSEDSV